MTSALLAETYRPSCVCIARVAFVFAELLYVGRVCRSYDTTVFCHINIVLLIHVDN